MTRYGDYLLVGDNATGIIHAFTLDGEAVDYLDTGYGRKASKDPQWAQTTTCTSQRARKARSSGSSRLAQDGSGLFARGWNRLRCSSATAVLGALYLAPSLAFGHAGDLGQHRRTPSNNRRSERARRVHHRPVVGGKWDRLPLDMPRSRHAHWLCDDSSISQELGGVHTCCGPTSWRRPRVRRDALSQRRPLRLGDRKWVVRSNGRRLDASTQQPIDSLCRHHLQ